MLKYYISLDFDHLFRYLKIFESIKHTVSITLHARHVCSPFSLRYALLQNSLQGLIISG